MFIDLEIVLNMKQLGISLAILFTLVDCYDIQWVIFNFLCVGASTFYALLGTFFQIHYS